MARAKAIILETQGSNKKYFPREGVENFTKEKLLEIITASGIVGMGGAAFPTQVKLNSSKPIDTLIINGCECEPYLTADHRLMVEQTEDIITGFKIIMKILGVKRGFIGIENNKPDAVKIMREKAAHLHNVEVLSLKVKYPQGAEKQQ